MKLNGIVGTGSGKVGNAVFSVRSGQQILREYQNKVKNPSTFLQVEQRAKFKLLSQLAADLSDYIAIPRDGNKSSRNVFQRINSQFVHAVDGVATVGLDQVQLTRSPFAMANFVADRSSGQYIEVSLASAAAISFDCVVYVAFAKNDDGGLILHDELVVSNDGIDNQFTGQMRYTSKEIIVYSYGVRYNSNKARSVFGNMAVKSATRVASLIATSQVITTGTTVTSTESLTLMYGMDTATSAEKNFIDVKIDGEAWSENVETSQSYNDITFKTGSQNYGMYVHMWKRADAGFPRPGATVSPVRTAVLINSDRVRVRSINDRNYPYAFMTIGSIDENDVFTCRAVYQYYNHYV